MKFKKLALAAAVAALPATGFSMEAMEDSALSGVTGQDGISIGLSLNATLDVGIEDTDGLGAPSTNSGLIIMDNVGLAGNISIEVDAASTASGGGVLEVGVSIPSLTIQTGDLYVGQGTDGSDVGAGLTNLGTEVAAVSAGDPLLDSVSLTLNDVDLTIQLGSEASNFLSLATTSVLDIDIGTLNDGTDNLTLREQSASGGGALVADQVAIRNVDVNGITGSITTSGLEIATNSALSGIDVAMMGLALGADDGTAPAIGNVYITGLDLSGQTITISGH